MFSLGCIPLFLGTFSDLTINLTGDKKVMLVTTKGRKM
jgi:hypothetical protein